MKTNSTSDKWLKVGVGPSEKQLAVGVAAVASSGSDPPTTSTAVCLRDERKKIAKDDDLTPEKLDWSVEMLEEAQNGDPELKDVCLWLSASSEPPKMEEITPLRGVTRTYSQQWPVLQLRDRLLHRQWVSTDGLQVIWQSIPPVRYGRALIQLTHGGITGGHLGVARTQALVRR